MRQLVITFAVTMLIAFAGALASNAQAATFAGVGSLPPLVQGYSPIETVRCVCGPRGCLRPAPSGLALLVAPRPPSLRLAVVTTSALLEFTSRVVGFGPTPSLQAEVWSSSPP